METMSEDGSTLGHISHLHDLYLADVAAGQPKPRCHACFLDCTAAAYQCAPCGYALHPACACTGREVRHPAHPDHPLALRLAPPYASGNYTCDACRTGGHVGFLLHCSHCRFDLHLLCAALPADGIVAPPAAHPPDHPLRLANSTVPCVHRGKPPGVVIICAVCREGITPDQWFYYCDRCADFVAHVGCVVPDALCKGVYPRIDMRRERAAAEQEAIKTAARLQQHQQTSAIIAARTSSTLSMLNAIQGLNTSGTAARLQQYQQTSAIIAARTSSTLSMLNAIQGLNKYKSGTADEIRKREEDYKQPSSYHK